jgi:hypothetical protein
MVQQQPDEFLAGVTGRADDGDFLCFHVQKSYREDRRVGDPNFLAGTATRRPSQNKKKPAGFASGVWKFPARSTF